MPQTDLPDLHDITMTPRRYRFRGTLKPPCRLKGHHTLEDLDRATSELAASLAAASYDALEMTRLGRFLAQTPSGDIGPLRRVAAACVRGLDLPDLPALFVVDQIVLCGERDGGRFELIHRYTLAN